MEKEIAKKMIDEVYQLLEGNKFSQLCDIKAPAFGIMFDGTKIIGPNLNGFVVENSPVIEKFFQKYHEMWDLLEQETWNGNDAKDLISYDNKCWDQFID